MVKRTGSAYGLGALAGTVAMMLVLLFASIAWACTSQPVIGSPGNNPAGSGLEPRFGPPNLYPVRVDGSAFQPGPVNIRWNSIDGSQLGMADGPNFSAQIRIPADAPPGIFYVVAFQRDALGNVSSIARAPFEVTPVESQPRQEVSGESTGGANGAMETSSTGTGGDTSLSTEGGQELDRSGQTASTSESVPSEGLESGPGGVANSARRESTAPAAPGSATVPNSANTEGSQVVNPSSRTLTSDLWSGFAKGRLVSGLPEAAPSERLPKALVVGSAFLALGMIALMGGFGLAEVHRRRTAGV